MKKKRNTYLISSNGVPKFIITTKKDKTLSDNDFIDSITLYYESMGYIVLSVDISVDIIVKIEDDIEYNKVITKYLQWSNFANIEV